MADILNNNGFWFAVGVVSGLIIEFASTWFFDWWRRPRLNVSFDGFRPVTTDATIIPPGTAPVPTMLNLPIHPMTVTAYRLRVANNGAPRRGKRGVREVDGEPFHPPSRAALDHERDRLFRKHGIKVVEHYDASRCYENPEAVVTEFLGILMRS